MMSTSYAGQETWSRVAHQTQPSRPSRSRRQKVPLRTFLATAISLVTAFVWFSMCKTLFNRDQRSGVTRRQLAEGGDGIDEDERSIVEGCLDLQEEIGVLHQSAVSSPEGDSSSRVTALVSMLSEAAAATESTQVPRADERLYLSEQLLEGGSGLETKGDGIGRLQTPLMQAYVQRRRSAVVTPALDPDSWIETIPSKTAEPEREARYESSSVIDDESMAGQASASHMSMQGHPEGLREILSVGGTRNHPYVRLPVLEEGVVPRLLRVSILFDRRHRSHSPHVYLVTLRNLFARRTLSQKDADILVHTVERLVTTSWFQSRRGPKGPFPIRIVDTLGTYFMLFDAIVCAIELLGDSMQLPLWWDNFAATFNTDFPLPTPGSCGHDVTKFHADLARRLSAALNIYKRGMRPPLAEVVALKKLLFCFPLGRHKFKSHAWAPWRKDGGC